MHEPKAIMPNELVFNNGNGSANKDTIHNAQYDIIGNKCAMYIKVIEQDYNYDKIRYNITQSLAPDVTICITL